MNNPTCIHCGLPPKSKSPLRRINRPSPYAAYFDVPAKQTPIIRAKIRSFTQTLEAELLDCDAAIARVENLLDMLKEERKEGESFIAQHKRLLSRVHALPPEVILEVFRYCLDEGLPPDIHWSYTLYSGQKPIPWVLSAVCPRWRSILRESPSMWSSFVVDYSSKLPFLEEALRLSRQAPLHFNLYLDDTDSAYIQQALVNHAVRWESVHIDVPQETLFSLGYLGHMPMLKKLSISLDRLGDIEIVDLTAVLSPFRNCPQLDELCISKQDSEDIPVVLHTTAISLPWANLSKLSVSFRECSSDVLRDLLVACVNLHQLEVVCGDGGGLGDDNYPPLSHSGITSLILETPPTFINYITYPALTHVCIQYMVPDTVLSFLSQHPRGISHFELILSYDANVPEPWDPVLELLPDVVHFTLRLESETLRHPPTPKNIFESLGDVRLPSLRTLTVDVSCHLLEFCASVDFIPLVVSASRNRLQKLEIYTKRCSENDWECTFDSVTALRGVATLDMPYAVSQIIEQSVTIIALLGFKEEGLEVSINGIPLTDRSATLYM